MPWIYILRCADDSFYVGSTRDLESRLQQHAIGSADAYTRSRRPLALAWTQECEHIEDAYVLEHKIKGWRREKKLALINGRMAIYRGYRAPGHTSIRHPGGHSALSVPFDRLRAQLPMPFDRLRAHLLKS
jgi:putative endonuclease